MTAGAGNRTKQKATGGPERTARRSPASKGTTGPQAGAAASPAAPGGPPGATRIGATVIAADVPTKVFGAQGPELVLGGQTVHYAVLTVRGTRDVEDFIGSGMPAGKGETVGEQLWAGAYISRDFGPVLGLLQRIISEEVTEDLLYGSSRDQVVDAVDDWFKVSGLDYLERILGGLNARAAELLERKTQDRVETALAQMEDSLERGLAETLSPTSSTD